MILSTCSKKFPELALGVLLAWTVCAHAQDRTLLFSPSDTGVARPIPAWGLDTAWLSADNVRRGAIFMGKPQVDVIRFSFTGDWPLTGGDLGASALTEFNDRMAIVNSYTDSHAALYLNNDSPTYDASFIGGDGRIAAVGRTDTVTNPCLLRELPEESQRQLVSFLLIKIRLHHDVLGIAHASDSVEGSQVLLKRC